MGTRLSISRRRGDEVTASSTLTELYDDLIAEARALVDAVNASDSATRAVKTRATTTLSAAALRRASVEADLQEGDAALADATAPEFRWPSEAQMVREILGRIDG